MPSSLSEPTSRRPATARKGVERWTADIERRISAETPRGYDAHEKRFARVPWREIPTRTRALEAHEFVNPTAYVVRASDAFVHPGHFLDKAGVLEADRVVREAKRDAREAATRALAERSRADASLRRETVRARSARASPAAAPRPRRAPCARRGARRACAAPRCSCSRRSGRR